MQGTIPHIAKERAALLAAIGTGGARFDIFFTMASADLYHPELFIMINPALSRDDVMKLPMAERRRMVAENPMLAALHYEARSTATFNHLLNGRRKPLGTIIDRRRRFDTQRGGSLHEHMMLAIAELADLPEWLSDEQRWHLVEAYVDGAISADQIAAQAGYDDAGNVKNQVTVDDEPAKRSKRARCAEQLPEEDKRPTVDDAQHPARRRGPLVAASEAEALADMRALLLTVQMHRHKPTCYKKGPVCRFYYPRNLQPKAKVQWEQTGKRKELKANPPRNHHYINNYVRMVLRGQRSNHDAQVICDAKGSSKYMMQTAAYATASPRADRSAANKAVQRAINRLPEGHTLKHKMQSVSLAIVGSQEISSQHASRFLLGRVLSTSPHFQPSFLELNGTGARRQPTALTYTTECML